MKYLLYLIPLLLFALAANAQQTTYTYSGQPMVGTLTGQAYPGADRTVLDGNIVLSQPLAPNQTNQLVIPESYWFGDNVLSSNPISFYQYDTSFSFSTVNGVITDWAVTIYFWSGGSTTESMSLTTAGDNYTYSLLVPSCPPQTYCTTWAASNTAPGTWAQLYAGVTVTPPPVATPAAIPAVVKATPTTASGGGGAVGWDVLIVLALLIVASLMRYLLRKSRLF
jgi:hypothetical protein